MAEQLSPIQVFTENTSNANLVNIPIDLIRKINRDVGNILNCNADYFVDNPLYEEEYVQVVTYLDNESPASRSREQIKLNQLLTNFINSDYYSEVWLQNPPTLANIPVVRRLIFENLPLMQPAPPVLPGPIPAVVVQIPSNMATFKSCAFYHVSVNTRTYVTPSTVTIDTAANHAAFQTIKSDKITKAYLSGGRTALTCEGNLKYKQYLDFMRLIRSIMSDYHPGFDDLLNLGFDQAETIQKVAALLTAAPRNQISQDGGANLTHFLDTVDVFKYELKLNQKLYNVLIQICDGHAMEILKRITDMDGRKALFLLQAHAVKTTDGQVIQLQSMITTFKFSSFKHPSSQADVLLSLCEQLDSCLQTQNTRFGNPQIRAAILNALPEPYRQFKIAKDINKVSETVEELLVQIDDHFTSHIMKSKREEQKANTANENNSNGGGKGKKKGKGKGGKGGKGKKAGNAQQTTNTGNERDRPIPECALCKTFPENERPSDIRHWFRDCPKLAENRGDRNKSSSTSKQHQSARSKHNDDDFNADQSSSSSRSTNNERKAGRIKFRDLTDHE